jgi:hypothetical protein
MQSFMDFGSSFDNAFKFKINDNGDLLNSSSVFYDDVSFNYVSILSELMTKNFIIMIFRAIVDMFLVLPSNLLTVIVIIRNKELWTPSNIVLSINGISQSIGTAIYLVVRSLYIYVIFFVPTYKESVFKVVWLTYTLMMRTGNNRLVK